MIIIQKIRMSIQINNRVIGMGKKVKGDFFFLGRTLGQNKGNTKTGNTKTLENIQNISLNLTEFIPE